MGVEDGEEVGGRVGGRVGESRIVHIQETKMGSGRLSTGSEQNRQVRGMEREKKAFQPNQRRKKE